MAFKLKHTFYSPSAVWNYIFISVFIILIGVYLIIMPKHADDYWFLMEGLDKWFLKQGLTDANAGGNIIKYGIPWEEIKATWSYHYNFDNARLGNILVPFFLLLPKWIGSGLCVAAWLFAMTGSFRLAKVNIRQSPLVPLAVFLWCFFMPWRNGMGCVVFQFNYLIPSAIGVYMIRLVLNGKYRLTTGIMIFILSFLTGWWHEGFALPIFVGIAVLLIFYKNARKSKAICAVIGLLAGMCILFTAPGMSLRCTTSISLSISDILGAIPYTLAMSSVYWFFVILIVINLFRRCGKDIFKDPIILFVLSSGLVPVALMMITYTESRVAWWSQFISVIGIMRLLEECNGGLWARYDKKITVLTFLGMSCVVIHLTSVDYYANRMRAALGHAIVKYKNNKDKAVFEDVLAYRDMPIINFKTPDVLFYSLNMQFLDSFLNPDHSSGSFVMIPEQLEYVDSDTGRILAGNAGMREFAYHLFMPSEASDIKNAGWYYVEADYGDGYKSVKAWMAPFRSAEDGKDYVYVYVFVSWLNQRFRMIKGVNIK